MLKSLRGQLIIIFSVFILVSVLTALYTANYYNKKEEITEVNRKLDDIEILLLQSFKEQENFFNFETVNEDFYITEKSQFIDHYENNYNALKSILNLLMHKNLLNGDSKKSLFEIDRNLNQFDSLFSKMLASIKKRGFRNFGIEGKMREAVHALEGIPEIDLVDILMLRRHEKDFILRQDPIYIDKHKNLINQVVNDLNKRTLINDEKRQKILLTLQNYAHYFNQVALYERVIGLKANSGFKHKLNEKTNQLLNSFKELKRESKINQANILRNLNVSIVAFWIIYLIIAIWVCIKISGKFTRRLVTLSRHLNYFVNTNFTARMNIGLQKTNDEVGILWNNFKKMETEIIEYIELFKEKVDEKTLELSFKTEKIEKQKKELEYQKEETDQKNKDLLDGMKYGWRIQQALLPNQKKVAKHLEEGFVFFSPKDVVSGDVYWTHKILSKQGRENIFSVIDCTGHGVPGAFMSILALNAVEDAVINKKHREPKYIVQSANNYVFSSLKYYNNDQYENQSKDGMDMAVCRLNRDAKQLQYSGANRSLYLIRENAENGSFDIGLNLDDYIVIEKESHLLFEIFPNKKTVGTLSEKHSAVFDGKTINVSSGDMVYLSSDGYADQFGGPKDKKFMTKRLKKLLIELHPLDIDEQKEILEKSFKDWKGDREQIDDVCIMGVRV